MITVKFAGKIWKYIHDGKWYLYRDGLPNGQLWRMSGENTQEAKREGVSFDFKDLTILKNGTD